MINIKTASTTLASVVLAFASSPVLAEQGAELLLITAMRGLPPAEMELLRRAYVAIMEG